MKIAIGGDHAGVKYKTKIVASLLKKGHKVEDKGPFDDKSVDYPDFTHPVSELVNNRKVDFGILICGSGNGVAMTANKQPNVRAALCWKRELAALARQHNNANILCIPARFVSLKMAMDMVHVFLEEEFEGGRHQRRVDKINLCF